MIQGETYRGIEFIRVQNLPENQKSAIKNWLNSEVLIKIQTEQALLTNCILYKDYRFWFENIYTYAVSGDGECLSSDRRQNIKPIRGLAFD